MSSGKLRTELLAPAGNRECLRAAVAAGADAVYFGLQRFSARARAANFTAEELPEVMAELREASVRGYVAVNTLLFDNELEAAADLVAAAAGAGADALIVQDLGLARLARNLAPDLPLHASTQMTLSAAGGIELARRELGISRAILPRELSLERIAQLSRETNVELEVFVHGALCISYGGQCLASFAMGGRSGNRGECAQPCRLPYRLLDGGETRDANRPHPLSPRDLAAWELVPELVRLGVRSLKIEGRLKGARYVAGATSFYRRALDAALAGDSFGHVEADLDRLAAGFSRGFTRGFLGGASGEDLVDGRHPGNLGVRVGTIIGCTDRGLIAELEKEVHAGDGLVIDACEGGPDRRGGRVYKLRPYLVSGRSAPATEIRFAKGALDLSTMPAGAVIWRTSGAGTPAPERSAFPASRRISVRATLSGRAGGPLELTLSDGEGNCATASWPGPLEPARRHPPTPELLAAQLGRLGNTPFALGGVDASGLDKLMLPKSALNALRREAVAGLLAVRETRARHAISEPQALERLRAEIPQAKTRSLTPQLTLLVRSSAQLEAALAWWRTHPAAQIESVCIDLRDSTRWPPAVEEIRAAGLSAALATPRVVEAGEEQLLELLAAAAPDAVLARNLPAVEFFRARDVELLGDASLNTANALSFALLRSLGLARVTIAPEAAEPETLPGDFDPAGVEAVLYRHEPMFHTRYCLFGGNGNCHSCARPCSRGELLLHDRKNARHPVRTDAAGRSTVFAARPVDHIADIPRLSARGLRHFRLELLDEDEDTTAILLDRATAQPM